MPMVYVSSKALTILNEIITQLKKTTQSPSRILKADVIEAALVEYSKKVNARVR